MSNDYRAVQESLQKGVDPALLCGTCPWDRYCVTPPTMTSGDVQKQLDEAKAKDEAERAEARSRGETEPRMPASTLITLLAVAGRDTQASVCPVFALRLKSSDGRKIADSVKAQMTGWAD